MKSLKFAIVFLSCCTLFYTFALADEDVDLEADFGISVDDRDEMESALDVLENLYGDRDVTIVGTTSTNKISVDDEKETSDDGDIEGGADIDSSEAGEKRIQISIIENEQQGYQEVNSNTHSEMEQTSAVKRPKRKPMPRKRLIAVAKCKTFNAAVGIEIDCKKVTGLALVRGGSPKSKKIACGKAKGNALAKTKGGSPCWSGLRMCSPCRFFSK